MKPVMSTMLVLSVDYADETAMLPGKRTHAKGQEKELIG